MSLTHTDVAKPFYLYVSEAQSITKGDLAWTLGPQKRPVAYLSKTLYSVSVSWLATIAMLVKETDKLILGQFRNCS